jgi:DNA adenine methylase
MQPILRWAGGKTKLIDRLVDFIPRDYNQRMYREPFFGAGSLFFNLKPFRAVLSDANPHLISCHKYIRDDWQGVSRSLRKYGKTATKKRYYKIRKLYNKANHSAAQAARFIYLNKTCFNGIFRVNSKGKFNVPYGRKRRPALPETMKLREASEALSDVKLLTAGYENAMKGAKSGDFIYLDPPYPPLNGTAYFTHYTMDGFTIQDHKKLAQCVRKLDRLGCLVMMSNADTRLIRRLYKRYHMISLPVTRYLSCKAQRYKVRELIITNYELGKGRSGALKKRSSPAFRSRRPSRR